MAEPSPLYEPQPQVQSGSDTAARPVQAPGGKVSPLRKKSRVRRLLSVIGPGLVTGAAGDDPSGIGVMILGSSARDGLA
jgi:hypothetical protein